MHHLTPYQARQIAEFYGDHDDGETGTYYAMTDVMTDIMINFFVARLRNEIIRLEKMKTGREIPPLADRTVQVGPTEGPWMGH